MRLVRLCWTNAARTAMREEEGSTKWFTCNPETLKAFQARCDAGNGAHGADSHWIEEWEVVETDATRASSAPPSVLLDIATKSSR